MTNVVANLDSFRRGQLVKVMRRLLAVAVLTLLAQSASASAYSIVDLGISDRTAYGVGLNNLGQVTFTVHSEGITEPGLAISVSGQKTTDLGGLGGSRAVAADINERGQITGFAETPDGMLQSFVCENGNLRSLGAVGERGSIASAINDAGLVAGSAFYEDNTRAYLFRGPDNIEDLGTLGGNFSSAADVNNAGYVVGSATAINDGPPMAFLYEASSMIPLGTLGGSWSGAAAINDASTIVGSSATALGEQHAALFIPGLSVVDLGAAGQVSSAFDINESGSIVGYIEIEPGISRAALFSLTHAPVLLQQFIAPDSSWTYLLEATGINDRGQIVGTGVFGNEPGLRAFLMTPVPEPTAIVLLVAAFGFVHYRTYCAR
jgi:probable HAF family extracellular repeat protein